MMLEEFKTAIATYWALALVVTLTGWLLAIRYHNGFNKYPGPLIASFTNWWRFFDVLGGQHQHTLIALHKKHGDIVRIGPNVLSFGDPKAIKEIYGLNKGYKKTAYYPVWSALVKGRPVLSMFATTDEAYHARFRRCVNHAFSMSTMVSYEPLVDSTTVAFLDQTQKLFVDRGRSCEFARWLQYYAFDNIGEMTWSKRLGFIDRFEDVDGIVETLGKFIRYCAVVGQQPWLDVTVGKKNPLKKALSRCGFLVKATPVAIFAAKRSAERRAALNEAKASQDGQSRGVDFLSRFIASQKDHPDFMTDRQVDTATISLPTAGSDTTASSLSAVFYYLLRNPRCYKKLMQELATAVDNGTVTPSPGHGLISWADAQKLPYLDACIQEAFRLFPAVGLLLERHVPPQGATICGERVPGGTIVGCNAWVVHRRTDVFGADAETYRPERWLDATADGGGGDDGHGAQPERLKAMKSAMLHFGAGTRTCLGKNISLLEMYKLIPTFLWNFYVEFVDPRRDWKTENSWFVRQSDFDVRFTPRARRAWAPHVREKD